MTRLKNTIRVKASGEALWRILSNLEMLEQYDPTVKTSKLVGDTKTGMGAKRRVTMKDGKNWFEEKVAVYEPGKALTYQLTDCSFPINGLKHSYSFEQNGEYTTLTQIMEYEVKFGMFGRLLDALMIRKQTQYGITKFMDGLKEKAETK